MDTDFMAYCSPVVTLLLQNTDLCGDMYSASSTKDPG